MSLQQVGGSKAPTGSLGDLTALISQAAGTLPSLFSGLGRRMLRAD